MLIDFTYGLGLHPELFPQRKLKNSTNSPEGAVDHCSVVHSRRNSQEHGQIHGPPCEGIEVHEEVLHFSYDGLCVFNCMVLLMLIWAGVDGMQHAHDHSPFHNKAHLRLQNFHVRLVSILIHLAHEVPKEAPTQVGSGDGSGSATAAPTTSHKVCKEGVKVGSEEATGGLFEGVEEPVLLLLVHKAVIEDTHDLPRCGGMGVQSFILL
eukprot:1158867-Pelagomonas_calceolata.AAC.7